MPSNMGHRTHITVKCGHPSYPGLPLGQCFPSAGAPWALVRPPSLLNPHSHACARACSPAAAPSTPSLVSQRCSPRTRAPGPRLRANSPASLEGSGARVDRAFGKTDHWERYMEPSIARIPVHPLSW